MKIAITGANGILGHDIIEACKNSEMNFYAITRNIADIRDKNKIQSLIKAENPDVLIHCAAYTNVEGAEDEKDLCFDVNVNGTRHVAEICKELDIPIVYFSTDYVFDGTKDEPWEVTDVPNPINHYGYTKWQGEEIIKKTCDKYFIIRISWLFGKNGKNFVATRLREALTGKLASGDFLRDSIDIASNQTGSPTYSKDLSNLVCEMIKTDKYGIYHATNEGYCTWAQLARKVYELAGSKVIVADNPTGEAGKKAMRPLSSKLSKKSLDESNFPGLRRWEEAVEEFVGEYEEIQI